MPEAAGDGSRTRLARACRVLATLGLARGCTGHLSARIPGSANILIRARGPEESGLQFTADEDIIEVTPEGRLVRAAQDGLAVPQEVFIHTAVYAARPDVQSVVHVHPPTVVLFTMTGVPLLPIFGAYDPSGLRLLLDGIPTFGKSALIANEALGRELADTLGKHNACMMRGHGITTAGPTIEAAALRAIALNELAEMNYRARLLGDPQPISQDDIDSFAPPPGAPSGAQEAFPGGALWRYYLRVTGA